MKTKQLYRYAFILAIITISYNIVEGLFSTYLGFEDESLALFGFGMDSFIEVISGLGIAHMILRIQNQPDGDRDAFEKTALKITGIAFYLLVIGLVLSSAYHIWIGHQPQTTFWGVVISSISILTMYLLVYYKRKVGNQLNSAPLLADANCTMVCIYMSIILLISSGLNELFGWMYVDSMGSLVLAYYSFKEGRECFQKVRSNGLCSCD